jgi:tRNA threonylcarbamoyladenosine biosynthesis protein TsaE
MPILSAHAIELFSNSAEQTQRIGNQFGALLEKGDVIALQGDLGAGKTTLVQGIASGWGSAESVTSPTFVLVNQYDRPDGQRMSHLDAYRLDNLTQAEDLDLDHYQDKGPLIVEWAERIKNLLPEQHLWVELFHVGESRRRMEFRPQGEYFAERIAQFQQAVIGLL